MNKPMLKLPTRADEPNPAQDLAMRIWDGQSPNLSLKDRVTRIVNGLKAQGLDASGITLPAQGFGKYL